MPENIPIISSVSVTNEATSSSEEQVALQEITVHQEESAAESTTSVSMVTVICDHTVVEVGNEVATVEVVLEVGVNYVGLSAYDIWLQEGNVGTEQDFLDSLQGEDGAAGPGLPVGGVAGQIPVKQSATNYHTAWVDYNKTTVGLGNVDNTSDVNKPISSAAQSALDLKADLVDGKVPISQLPVIVIAEFLGAFTNTTAALANAGVQASQRGDWFTVNDDGTGKAATYIVTTDSPTTLSHVTKIATPTDTVLSVTNSDGSITFSPTTGNVVGSLNMAHANSWTAAQTVIRTALGATASGDGWVLDNTTAATVSVMQTSPRVRRRGRGFFTNSSSSYPIDFADHVVGYAGITAAGIYKMQWSGNGGAYADAFWVDVTPSGRGFEFFTPSAQSNSTPGTTRVITINNTGSNSYTDYRFSGVHKASIGVNSSGEISLYSTGGNGVGYYTGVSGSSSLYAFNYAGWFGHYGWVGATGWVYAGSQGAPPSTLTSGGSTGYKTQLLLTNATLASYTDVLVLGDDNFTCTGTITNQCNAWTTEGDCNARGNHGGICSWSVLNCSDYNGQSQSACESGHPGCAWDTASCAGPGDQSTCESQNNAYGGTCAWVDAMPSCSGFDEGTCSSYSGSGCTSNYFDCTTLNGNEGGCTGHGGCSVGSSNSCGGFGDTASCNGTGGCSATVSSDCNALNDGGGDGTMCATQGECTYDSGSGVCSGFYFTSCGGDNSTCSGSPFDNCSGNYSSYSCVNTFYNGNCSGTSGVCGGGTVSCSNITEAYCGSEPGCSGGTGVVATFPVDTGASFYRTYRVRNGGTTANLTMLPGTGATAGGTSSVTIGPGKSRIFTFFFFQVSCSTWSGTDSGECTTGHSGCAWVACSSLGDEWSCLAEGGQCSWDGMSCVGTGNCNGTWTAARDWAVVGGVF